MTTTAPTIGRIVHYMLTEQDAVAINTAPVLAKNRASEGDVYPAMIVRTWGGTSAQLQVFYDGAGTYWATSRGEGAVPGTWAWPTRVGA